MVATGAESAASELLALAQTCARLEDADEIMVAALPVLASLSGADATLALGSSVDGARTGLHVTHRVGLELDVDASVVAEEPPHPGDVVEAAVPASWQEAGIQRVAVRRLAGRSLLLVLAWREPERQIDDALRLGLSVLDAELRRTTSTAAPVDPPAGMEEFERRHALEINDNVVQGLVAAAYALDQGQVAECAAFLNRTLASARAMMDGMLEPHSGRDNSSPVTSSAPRRLTSGPRTAPRRGRWSRPTTPTPCWSSTTPTTCGCCCAHGWTGAVG